MQKWEISLDNLRQKLKLFNYRPIVLIFLGLISGALISNFFVKYTITVSVILAIAVIVLVVYSILHKTFKYAIILGITIVLGFSIFSVYMNAREPNASDLQDKYIKGEVTRIVTYDDCLSLLLENVKLEDSDIDYNIVVYYYNTYQDGYINIKLGSEIGFTVAEQFAVETHSEDGVPHTYNVANNIQAKVSTYEVDYLGEKGSIRYSILARIRSNLRKGLNNLNGEMIYSAMFGDKTDLNDDLYDAYKGSGVAHLLAVSGLHVGLVVAIIYWILRKCKVKGWYRVAIVIALLFAYAYLCNFSYSVIRASIMSIVLMIAPLLFSEYDLLTSICFAGCLIFIIEPIALFDLGAQLSFGCVLGIAMLHPIFSRWMRKLPINKSIKDGFSISLSTIISTCAIMIYYFGYIQPIGLISNLIILPIFSCLFTIAFIVSMLGLIFPFVNYILVFINPLFEWMNWAIILIANKAKSIEMPGVNYLTILLSFGGLTFASKYNLVKGARKLLIVGICVCVLIWQMVLI